MMQPSECPSSNQPAHLERTLWLLLSTPDRPDTLIADLLHPQVTMLLPGGTALFGTAAVLSSLDPVAWTTHEICDLATHHLAATVHVLTYRLAARRNQLRYSALVSSAYIWRDERWLLALHQQTLVQGR